MAKPSVPEQEKELVYALSVLANLMVTMPEATMTALFEDYKDPMEKLNYFVGKLREATHLISTRRSMIDETVKGFQALNK